MTYTHEMAKSQYFKQWAKGKKFQPHWVRNKLGNSLKAIVRDVEITFSGDYYESVKMAYSFFSGITHSNLKSAEYSVRIKSDGSVEVPTGGIVEEKEALVKCLLVVICSGLIRSLLISSAVFSVDLLQRIGKDISKIQEKLNILISSN